ncbi:MAG: Ada metal-binding domain-containing protein, partial [Thermoflexales bacterium]
MTEQQQWQAVLDRDARQDGAFVYAVKTTGVYCRPSCASRQPRRENVLFFASPAQAAAAGFR